MSFLSELVKKRTSLNHTRTRVTTVEGKTLIEEVLQGEHSSCEISEENQLCPGFVIDTKPDLQVAEILPSLLYLGSQDVTQDTELLQSHKITHILSVGVSVPHLPHLTHLSYKFLPACDVPDENIDCLLTTALPWMEEMISKGSCVFVHCNAGVSRAPTVVIAYLMMFKKLSYCEASTLVKQQRPTAKPNTGFVNQLMELESKLKNNK